MSEEEKKAIEQLNNLDFCLESIDCNKCVYQEREDCMGCYEHIIKTILNLIEKQANEIEELKNADLTLVYIDGVYYGEQKWKQKIKDKIEEVQKEYEETIKKADFNEIEKMNRINFEGVKLEGQRSILQELLEKGE